MTVSDIIASVSVLIAGLALWRSWRAGRAASKATRDANELQERMVALEEAREKDRLTAKGTAILTAKIIAEQIAQRRSGRIDRHLLRVENTGAATAREVTILLDGKPVMEHPAVSSPAVQHVNTEEIRVVGPGSHFHYVLALHQNLCPPFEFEATWDDDSGQQGRYATTLTF